MIETFIMILKVFSLFSIGFLSGALFALKILLEEEGMK